MKAWGGGALNAPSSLQNRVKDQECQIFSRKRESKMRKKKVEWMLSIEISYGPINKISQNELKISNFQIGI